MNDPNERRANEQVAMNDLHEVARVQLREERLVVDRVHERIGHVTVARRVETRTVHLPAEETVETLVIEVAPGAGMVTIDGEELRAGERREIEVYRVASRVVKDIVAYQDVRVLRRAVTAQETLTVELGREVLVVDDPQRLVVEDRIVGGTEESRADLQG
ncbi:YsnF/AvaK domain-containing protein [Deinococcus maricopensis]|nr:YsnF/AvaK domain-containing protein [Deinococcus maricopensis]